MARRLLIYLLAAGTVVLWGASFPLTKIALGSLGPTSVAFVRWAISACILATYIAMSGRKLDAARDLLRRDTWTVVWVALTGITLFYFLENLALRFTSAVNAGVLANLTTVFMVLIATLWLRERLNRSDWVAIGMAFAGAVLVSRGSTRLTLTGTGLFGDALMVLATLFAAIYSVGGKRLTATYPADVVTAVVAILGTLLLLPLALWEGLSLQLPASVWAILLLLGVGSGALANLWWMHILSRTDASRAAMILLLIPLVSTALAVLLLHEAVPLPVLVGGILVLTGVAFMERNLTPKATGLTLTAQGVETE
jgi:drug/metabolite transporter (DMT)-like permease